MSESGEAKEVTAFRGLVDRLGSPVMLSILFAATDTQAEGDRGIEVVDGEPPNQLRLVVDMGSVAVEEGVMAYMLPRRTAEEIVAEAAARDLE